MLSNFKVNMFIDKMINLGQSSSLMQLFLGIVLTLIRKINMAAIVTIYIVNPKTQDAQFPG